MDQNLVAGLGVCALCCVLYFEFVVCSVDFFFGNLITIVTANQGRRCQVEQSGEGPLGRSRTASWHMLWKCKDRREWKQFSLACTSQALLRRRRMMWKLQVRLKKQTAWKRRNLRVRVCEFVWGQEKVPLRPRRRHQPSTTSFVKAKLNNQGISSSPSPCCLAQSRLISRVTQTTGIKYMKTIVIFWPCCTQTKKKSYKT